MTRRVFRSKPTRAPSRPQEFTKALREYPGERHPKRSIEWRSSVSTSILTYAAWHPSQRPPMVRPEDDNEMGAADVEAFLKNLVENGQPDVKAEGLGGKSLSSGKVAVIGAPEGVDQANFDGQREFTGL